MSMQKRPFHESVIEAIGRANTFEALETLAQLIKETKIPGNHDEIISAWRERLVTLDIFNDMGVPLDLLIEKNKAVIADIQKRKVELLT